MEIAMRNLETGAPIWDLIVALAAGEISEGRAVEDSGLDRITLRGLMQDSIARALYWIGDAKSECGQCSGRERLTKRRESVIQSMRDKIASPSPGETASPSCAPSPKSSGSVESPRTLKELIEEHLAGECLSAMGDCVRDDPEHPSTICLSANTIHQIIEAKVRELIARAEEKL